MKYDGKQKSVVTAPLQPVSVSTSLLPARPKGFFIRDVVDITHSCLSIKNALNDPKDNGKGKLIEADEPRPKNSVQTKIYLLMDEVNKFAELKSSILMNGWNLGLW